MRFNATWMRSLGVYAFLVVLLAVMGITSPSSLAPGHLLDLLRQTAPLGIVAAGQTVALLIGGIDLSVEAVITLTNLAAASLMVSGNGAIPLAVAVCLGIALLVGLLNGLAVAKLRIPPFIATLAMGTLIQGGYLIYTRGAPTGKIAPGFRVIAEGRVMGLPWAGIIWLLITLALAWLLRRTVFGRQLYATGGNPQTARLSGIPTTRVIILGYVISAVAAAASGLMLSAYIGLASMSVGSGYGLNSITAVVIGGTSFAGGQGGLSGTLAGALAMVLLQSLLTTVNIGDPGKLAMQGLLIILMVAAYQVRLSRPSRPKKALH